MQKAKRSSSTSIHPTRSSKGIPGIPAARSSKGIPDIPDIPDIPVIRDVQPLWAILQGFLPDSTSSAILQHSPIRMHILDFDWFPQKLHRVPVETLLQTFILQRKGDVAISVKRHYSPE